VIAAVVAAEPAGLLDLAVAALVPAVHPDLLSSNGKSPSCTIPDRYADEPPIKEIPTP